MRHIRGVWNHAVYCGAVRGLRCDYEDSLAVTNLDDLPDYMDSLTNLSNVVAVEKRTLKRILEQEMRDGVLHVPKEYGMFACRK